MKNVLFKNTIKSIINTRRRFLSILLMAMLGVGFFSGLVSTAPDIQQSLDTYLDEKNMYDIEIVSTLGLTDEDIDAIKQIETVDNAYGIKTQDSLIDINKETFVAKVIEYSENINTPVIIEGENIKQDNECLVNKIFMDTYGYSIGDKVNIESDDFEAKELTIVGIVQSPLYISIGESDVGSTTLGSGTLDLYMYVNKNIFTFDYYSEIYVHIKNAKQLETNTTEYEDLIQTTFDQVEAIKTDREEARYNEIKGEAEEELNKAKQEYEDAKKEAEEQIADAEKKIEDAENEISKNEKTISDSEKEISQNEAKASREFASAEKEIEDAEKEISENETKLENSKTEFEDQKKEAEDGIKQIDEGINQAKTALAQLEEAKAQLEQNSQDTTQIDIQIEECNTTISNLETQKKDIEEQISSAEEEIETAETQINQAKITLAESKTELEKTKKQTNTQIANAKSELEDAKQEIQDGKAELEDSKQELEDSKKELEEKLEDAQKEIDDAQKEIDKIEKAVWYTFDREDNNGYTMLKESIESIKNISSVFPILFYLIAILISLNSMTRMVEEERIEIGTLKALGYKNSKIIFKYIIYSLLACLIGGILGMFLTYKMIPLIIWNVYEVLFYLPEFYAPLRISYGVIGIIIAIICICGATLFASISELKNMPSVLMRPKAPKKGKRVFLERIKIIWKRLSFSQKVTIRNVFRYKKRVLMTIIGITGCTALITAGFGLKDSIAGVVTAQFGEVFTYDATITLQNEDNMENLEQTLAEYQGIDNILKINMETGQVKFNNSDEKDVILFVPENAEEINKSVNLYNWKTDEIVNLNDDGIIITEKLAETLEISIEDKITLIDNDKIEYEFEVTNIVKNYVDNYVFMTKNLYEQNLGYYETNMLLFRVDDNIDNYKSELSEKVLENESVSAINFISGSINSLEKTLGSLNYVIAVLIIASAILAFVVLYNLSNINISERKREIATLKVLGFYNNEVDSYINKETLILTGIGIVLGLILGFFLNDFLITTCEFESIHYLKQIHPISYIYSALISTTFTVIVNIIIHYHLKKVDMIESLKSVE